MKPRKKSNLWKYAGVVLGIMLIVVCILVALNLFGNYLKPKPNPIVVSMEGYETFEGLNYVFKVKVTVENRGGNGLVTVYAEIYGGDKYEQQYQTIYMYSGERKTLEFTFDISFLRAFSNPIIRYRAWAEPAE